MLCVLASACGSTAATGITTVSPPNAEAPPLPPSSTPLVYALPSGAASVTRLDVRGWRELLGEPNEGDLSQIQSGSFWVSLMRAVWRPERRIDEVAVGLYDVGYGHVTALLIARGSIDEPARAALRETTRCCFSTDDMVEREATGGVFVFGSSRLAEQAIRRLRESPRSLAPGAIDPMHDARDWERAPSAFNTSLTASMRANLRRDLERRFPGAGALVDGVAGYGARLRVLPDGNVDVTIVIAARDADAADALLALASVALPILAQEEDIVAMDAADILQGGRAERRGNLVEVHLPMTRERFARFGNGLRNEARAQRGLLRTLGITVE